MKGAKAAQWQPTLEDALISEYIMDRAGELGLEVAKLIRDKQPVQGVDILEMMGDRKPSEVRKILYKLEDGRVAEYQKDTDKSGWETFIWRLTLDEVKYQINKERHKLIKDLTHQLELERENSFYICSNEHDRTIFEDAVAFEFKCPECDEAMEFVDNEARIRVLESALQELKELAY